MKPSITPETGEVVELRSAPMGEGAVCHMASTADILW